MAEAQFIAFYITVCCIAFIISKIIISVLLYKRWKRKHMIYEVDGLSERDRGFESELEATGDIKHWNILVLHGYYTCPH
uniref:Uncharacterized protein n=1 Tax=Populus trichocarpa TaxID=3694 RepID=A0A2K1YI55_POPTR